MNAGQPTGISKILGWAWAQITYAPVVFLCGEQSELDSRAPCLDQRKQLAGNRKQKEWNQDKNKGSVGEEKRTGGSWSVNRERSKGADKGDQQGDGGRSELHVLVLAARELVVQDWVGRVDARAPSPAATEYRYFGARALTGTVSASAGDL